MSGDGQWCRVGCKSMRGVYLACDNSWREALKLGILVKEPGHDAAISVHVWCRNVLLRSNHILDCLRATIAAWTTCIGCLEACMSGMLYFCRHMAYMASYAWLHACITLLKCLTMHKSCFASIRQCRVWAVLHSLRAAFVRSLTS